MLEKIKNWPVSPAFWLVFGLIGFPLVCFCGQVVIWALLLRLMPSPPRSASGWGGSAGAYFGPLLGIVAATVSEEWNRGARLRARRIAGVSGAIIGALWGWHLLACPSFVWVGDFGSAVPPLAWAAGLLGFGLLARHAEPV